MGVLDERNKKTASIMERLERILSEEFGEIFRTGANLNTITFCVSEEGETETFGSVKFTLHKTNYNLDDEIEEFEDFREQKLKAEELKAQKKALKERDEAAKAAARAERNAIKEKVMANCTLPRVTLDKIGSS